MMMMMTTMTMMMMMVMMMMIDRYDFPLGFQGGLTPIRRVDFLSFEKLEFAEMMLSKFP